MPDRSGEPVTHSGVTRRRTHSAWLTPIDGRKARFDLGQHFLDDFLVFGASEIYSTGSRSRCLSADPCVLFIAFEQPPDAIPRKQAAGKTAEAKSAATKTKKKRGGG